MRRTLTALLLLLLTAPAWSQVTVPGTFNRPQPLRDTDLYMVPTLTTPQASLGSGLSAPVLITGQTMVVSSPQVAYGQATAEEAENAPGGLPAEVALNEPPPGTAIRGRTMQVARFDYVIAPTAGFSPGEPGEEASLGEMAAAMRKGPPPTQRSFTNDDILRMNQSSSGNFAMPAGKTPQAQPSPPPTPAPNPPKNQSQEKPHSPFSPPLSAEQ
jgi:hypothetical protein